MLAGINDILIISTKEDLPKFENLLKDGSQLGIKLSYAIQEKPNGLAEAFIIGEKFIGNEPCALILGDNIFYGAGLRQHLINSVRRAEEGNCTIFGYYVNDPERYGIIEFDKNNNAVSIEEKPKHPKSNYCVTGLYFYPNDVVAKAKRIKPSKRNELEITTLNNFYLKEGRMHVTTLGRGYAWLDTGTQASLADAIMYVKTIEEHQGIVICCPEEIAFINNWVKKEALLAIGNTMAKNNYRQHLINVANGLIQYEKLNKDK